MVFDWLHLLLFHTFVIFGELMVIASLLHMIYQRRTPSSMIAWMLAIVLLPYLAVPLYFVLGSRKRRSKYLKTAFDMRETDAAVAQANPIDGILRNNGIPGATSGWSLSSTGRRPTPPFCSRSTRPGSVSGSARTSLKATRSPPRWSRPSLPNGAKGSRSNS